VSFNEADIGVNVSLTRRARRSRRGRRGRLAARGLRTKWLLGDCANMAGCVSYARPIWESAAARPYLGVFASTPGLEHLRRGARFLYDFGRSTACRSADGGGWDAQLWQRPDQFPTWTNAFGSRRSTSGL